MVKQYPHYLFLIEATPSSQDENGDFTESKTSYKFISMCREEVNSKGAKIDVGGGKFIVFNSLIQIPSKVNIKAGQKVAIFDDMDKVIMRISGESLRIDNAQMHSRLWL